MKDNLKALPCPYRDVCSVTRKHQAKQESHQKLNFDLVPVLEATLWLSCSVSKVVVLSMQLAVVSCYPGASQACSWGPPLLASGVKLLDRSGDAFYKSGAMSVIPTSPWKPTE